MAAGLMALAACATSGAGQSQAPAAAPAASAAAPSEVAYVLGAGDKLRVIVYGEQDLSGEFDVTGTGKVSLPLVGQVQAAGLTLDQFEKETRDKLSQGYLTNPKVSAEVLNYRPFYILGEVDKPGQYPYTSDMTVLNAIAVAGGYTYRANNDTVYITRGNGAEAQYPASQQVKVLPGDVVRVPERFF
ncbi:polysaccharide export protein [Parvibaculum sedimenti]|uniref:Polysaccharide export protein n=2 Tax=Parvibaculum sedimenti TaxID=2608632 RepID=A0A6N6VL77_9HYPH|nr:polysaccharide export protein [Parvibaculum sedimenti]